MRQQGRWMERLLDGADLSGEALPNQPIVELFGDRRVLIECHGGVTEYTDTLIRVRLSYGQACISGCGLVLSRMTREQLVITGKIEAVQLVRGRCGR